MKGLKDFPLFWQTDYSSLKYVFIIILKWKKLCFCVLYSTPIRFLIHPSSVLCFILPLSIKTFFMNINNHTAFMKVPHAGLNSLCLEFVERINADLRSFQLPFAFVLDGQARTLLTVL